MWGGVFTLDAGGARASPFVSESGFPPERGGVEPAVEGGTAFFVSECCRGAVPVAANAAHDLALLLADDGKAPGGRAPFRRGGTVRLSEEVVVFGFPLRGALSPGGNLTTGVVTALSGIRDDLARFQIGAQIRNGSSGSPVMNRTGTVVGMASSSLGDHVVAPGELRPQDVNFAVRAPILQLAGVEPKAASGAGEPSGGRRVSRRPPRASSRPRSCAIADRPPAWAVQRNAARSMNSLASSG